MRIHLVLSKYESLKPLFSYKEGFIVKLNFLSIAPDEKQFLGKKRDFNIKGCFLPFLQMSYFCAILLLMARIGNAKVVLAFVVLLLAVIASAGAAFYFYQQYKKTSGLQVREEIARYEKVISSIIELPKDDTPQLATVTDKTKLQQQPFFAKAENGDKVLIYLKSQKAILFRPSTGKIIEIAPITIDQQQGANNQESDTQAETTPSPTSRPSPTPRATATPASE